MLKDSQLERGFRAAIYSGALAAGGYLVFCLVTGWNEVLAAVAKVGAGGVLVAVFLSLCNYGLRFVRWQAYLRALNHSVPWTLSLEIYLAGFSLTTTPGKAGEMLRSVLLRPWGVPFGASIAALLSERLSDVLAIVILALAGLSAHQSARPIFYVSAILVLLGILALSRAESVFGVGAKAGQSSKLGRWLVHLHDVLKQTRQCHTPALLSVSTVLGVLAWGAEAWAFYLILYWMGLEVSFTSATFVYAISMLAGALSFMPGGLGGAEVTMVGLLVILGVGNAEAVSATIIIRLATLWFAVALGMLALVRTRNR